MIRDVISNDGYVISSLLSLLIILIVKKINRRRFSDLIRLFANSNYLRIYLKEHRFLDLFDFILFLNFIINCTTHAYILYSSFINLIEINTNKFATISIAFTIFLVLKLILKLLTGYLFDLYKTISILIFQQVSTINFIGIMLLPINLLLVFGLNFDIRWIIISTVLIAITILIGMLKTIQTNLNFVLSNFLYFILYICTLEIGPYVIIYDQLKNYNYL
jgi:hypothetical protein